MMSWKACTSCEDVSLINSKRFGNVLHSTSPEKIETGFSEAENNGEDKHKSETQSRHFDARNERIETGAVVTKCRGFSCDEMRTKRMLSIGREKDRVREEIVANSGTTKISVQN